MSLSIGALNVIADGYYFEVVDGHPYDAVPEVRGQRVLIPGRAGLYTPPANFEADHLLIRMHGWVGGTGADAATRIASFDTRMAALLTACDVANRQDVTITADGHTISAGFLRIVGPATILNQAREFDIEFDATNPPEWT